MFFDPADYLQSDPAQAGSERERGRLLREAEQRAKLCEATVALAAGGHLEDATIQQAARRAGVGQGTYYKLYRTRDTCLREAFERCAGTVLARVEEAAARGGDERGDRVEAGLRELLGTFEAHPAVARLLLLGISAGDDQCRDSQQRWLRRFAGLLTCESGVDGVPQRGSAAWMATAMLKSMLALHLEDDALLPEMLEELVPVASLPWSVEMPGHVAETGDAGERPSIRAAQSRRDATRARASRDQRERILAAMTEVAGTTGYSATRVADVQGRAGVSAPVFYEHFGGKAECLLTAFDHTLGPIQERVERAVEGIETCAERAVAGLRALVEALAGDPHVARLVTIEVRAAGSEGEQRYGQAVLAFAQLIGGGETDEVTRMTASATAEMIASEVNKGRTAELEDLLPQLVFTTLAPYLGGEKAKEAAGRAGVDQAR